uniref:Uncharacterized protein n=1 Tax=Candidatus Kentrum sp. FW TaxID=2126338 RepID=A0A450RT23_9GAMM|nr:MAG: hypothetical protein BECKFW1821A_GA0114235_100187 [Candidatus Kentron sp. FW]
MRRSFGQCNTVHFPINVTDNGEKPVETPVLIELLYGLVHNKIERMKGFTVLLVDRRRGHHFIHVFPDADSDIHVVDVTAACDSGEDFQHRPIVQWLIMEGRIFIPMQQTQQGAVDDDGGFQFRRDADLVFVFQGFQVIQERDDVLDAFSLRQEGRFHQ